MSKLIYWGTTNYKNTRQAFEPEKPASRLTPPVPPITLPSHPPPSHTSSITQSSTTGSRPASQPAIASQPAKIATAAKQASRFEAPSGPQMSQCK